MSCGRLNWLVVSYSVHVKYSSIKSCASYEPYNTPDPFPRLNDIKAATDGSSWDWGFPDWDW